MQYTYDGVGNVTRYDDFVDASNTMPSLTYDPIDRLITASTASEGRAYTYDGNGNILGLAIGSRTMNHTYENDRLRDITNALRPYSFQYDARGNVIHDGRTGFTYNDASQMTAAGANTFAYDGLDMRVRMQKSGIATYFIYGLDGELLIGNKQGQNRTNRVSVTFRIDSMPFLARRTAASAAGLAAAGEPRN